MRISRKMSVFVVTGLAVLALLPSCATRGYARRQARDVDNKVTALAAVVQENAERLDATDGRARQGISDAAAAHSAALAAQASADRANGIASSSQSAANAAQAAADAANRNAQNASSQLATFQSAGPDRYDAGPVTIVMFKAGKWNLSKDAMKALDQIVAPIAGQEAGYLVEIHGFASAEGPETMNVNLSQERSEAVQRYLVSRGASLTRTSIVGLGTDKPIADNATPSGREQNRRAEVRVYTAAAK